MFVNACHVRDFEAVAERDEGAVGIVNRQIRVFSHQVNNMDHIFRRYVRKGDTTVGYPLKEIELSPNAEIEKVRHFGDYRMVGYQGTSQASYKIESFAVIPVILVE